MDLTTGITSAPLAVRVGEANGIGVCIECDTPVESTIDEGPDDNTGVVNMGACLGSLLQATSSQARAIATAHLYA